MSAACGTVGRSHHVVRRALRDLVRSGRGTGGAAETTVAAAHKRRCQGAQSIARRAVHHLPRQIDDRAHIGAFVDDGRDARAANQVARRRQRFVNPHPLFAMHKIDEVDSGLGIGKPHGRVAQHRRHRRQRLKPVFKNEPELPGIQGVGPQADAERIQHRIRRPVDVRRILEAPVHQLVVVDHLR